MRFCMVTTFFGAHSFGGDAVYVERLAKALLRRGHEVTVVYCQDAFEAVRGSLPVRDYTAPAGLVVESLKSSWGLLSPLLTHQTGRPLLKKRALKEIFSRGYDVVHLHNISLVGAMGLLEMETPCAVKLMTAHEHWLICPLSLLWKYDAAPCDREECVRCTLKAGRPPQLWRSRAAINRRLSSLNALIFPSQHTLETHKARGIEHQRMVRLPYFLPSDWAEPEARYRHPRPYLLAVGRLVKEKGFQCVIALMKHLPGVDLLIAGTGGYERELRRMSDPKQVHFLGMRNFKELSSLYAGAVALVVPSLFYETFGFVVIEAFSAATPVVAHNRGSLPELIHQSGGGLLYDTDGDLLEALRRITSDSRLRDELGLRGRRALEEVWDEEGHIQRYMRLIGC